ncbi:MAG: hypothetical protein ACJ71G_08005 [Nitrososphaeraceae archaeon]
MKDPSIPVEDKEKIQNNLLTKPFLPYIRRHSSLSEKARKLKTSTLEQHAGWVPGSNMQKRYVHYFGKKVIYVLLVKKRPLEEILLNA